jgi:hypothetical protein
MKFVGAGQGRKALIAELLAGEIGRRLGLRVPELAFIVLHRPIAEGESHAEIRDLLKASIGLNLGLRFLPNSLEYNPQRTPPLTAAEAAAIVWFDAYVTNVDRTPRNVNMLLHDKQLWLIDHGACLYFHHSRDWQDQLERSRNPFSQIKQHALLPYTGSIEAADAALRPLLSEGAITEIVSLIPDEWLRDSIPAEALRAAYVAWLLGRRDASSSFVEEASHARAQRV